MKICIVLGPFQPMPPMGFGAVEKVWCELARMFGRLGHTVVLVGKGGAAQATDCAGLHVVPLRGFAASGWLWLDLVRDFMYAIAVLKYLEPSDIVVTNSFWTPVVLSLAGRKSGIVVVHVARFPKGQMRLYGAAHVLQAISNAVADEIIRQAPHLRAKVRVLPYPVDLAIFQPPQPARVFGGKVTIVYVGRIHPEKGVHLLVGALRLALDKVPTTRLRIIGPSAVAQGGGGEPYMDSLRNAASDLPVEFVGPIADQVALAAEYRAAHCFCYPSLADKGEAFGLSVLEAMATGLPVVVSDLACFRDFLEPGRDGLVFDHRAGDAERALAGCLVKLLSVAEFAAEISVNASRSAKRFGIESVAKEYLALFEASRHAIGA